MPHLAPVNKNGSFSQWLPSPLPPSNEKAILSKKEYNGFLHKCLFNISVKCVNTSVCWREKIHQEKKEASWVWNIWGPHTGTCSIMVMDLAYWTFMLLGLGNECCLWNVDLIGSKLFIHCHLLRVQCQRLLAWCCTYIYFFFLFLKALLWNDWSQCSGHYSPQETIKVVFISKTSFCWQFCKSFF